MSMGFSGIKGAAGAQGSSRIIDIAKDPSSIVSSFGSGQALNVVAPKSVTQNAISRGPWNGVSSGLSGANKDRHGGVFEFLAATSFNVGIGTDYAIPIVGRGPSPKKVPPEIMDYWALEIMLGQGMGLAHSGFAPVNPPFLGILNDVCVFFAPADYALSSSSYGGFTDLDGQGGCAGYGLFVGTDGKWHWGVRIARSGSPTALDVDVPLNFDPTNPQGWPLLAANADQMVRTKWEWFASRNGQKPIFQLTIGDNPPLIKTTLADIGTIPVPAGLATELPDGYSQSDETFGWTGIVRAGPGTGGGNASGTMTTSGVQASGASHLNLAISGPSGSFQIGDFLTVSGQTFQVTANIAAAATVTVQVTPNVGTPIADAQAVTYTAQTQKFGIKMLAHLVAGPAVPTTVLA
jgi:hypothetical protein